MAKNPNGSTRFLFILSTERSGSTLLSFMLGGHSGVIAPPELHLMAYSSVDEWLLRYPAAIKSLAFVLDSCGLGMPQEQVAAQFRGRPAESVYRWIAGQENVRPRVIVDKTPKYARDFTALRRTATLKPLYIWLIRHPLGVAASQLALRLEQRRQRNTDWASRLKYPWFRMQNVMKKHDQVYNEVAYWTWVNMQIEQFLATIEPERQQRVYFEQLVREPRTVMECLCRWLDVPFELAMLDPGAQIPTALEPKLGDPKMRQHAGIDPAVADSWRQSCSEQMLDSFRGRFLAVPTREVMGRWGIT